jgi:hypothetical protein
LSETRAAAMLPVVKTLARSFLFMAPRFETGAAATAV